MQEPELITAHAQFFTAICLEWRPLFKPDKYKDIIESLRFLIRDGLVVVYGFVLMQNYLHLLWQMRRGHQRENVQRDFLKFTAQQIKQGLTTYYPQVLEQFRMNVKDRTYQFWKRKPLCVDLYTEKVAWQKLNFLHQNPVRASLCQFPEAYRYSPASFYHTGVEECGFLSHMMG